MSNHTIKVVFYHSVACPRCQLSGHMLRRVLRAHPDVEVTKVELLTHMAQARAAGVKTIPALVAHGRSLTGIILTPGSIERFLASL